MKGNPGDLQVILAKRAGFKYYDNPIVFGPPSELKSGWYYPNGNPCHGDLPDFPNDLNAIFEFLMPDLWICEMSMLEGIFFKWTVGSPAHSNSPQSALDENPATALCLAIEKLLGGTSASKSETLTPRSQDTNQSDRG